MTALFDLLNSLAPVVSNLAALVIAHPAVGALLIVVTYAGVRLSHA